VNNRVNCWKPIRALGATTRTGRSNVNAKKTRDLAISSQAAELRKVQRLSREGVGPK
jgi:hypothetical protein